VKFAHDTGWKPLLLCIRSSCLLTCDHGSRGARPYQRTGAARSEKRRRREREGEALRPSRGTHARTLGSDGAARLSSPKSSPYLAGAYSGSECSWAGSPLVHGSRSRRSKPALRSALRGLAARSRVGTDTAPRHRLQACATLGSIHTRMSFSTMEIVTGTCTFPPSSSASVRASPFAAGPVCSKRSRQRRVSCPQVRYSFRLLVDRARHPAPSS
jgi:hypothetical protein